MDYAAFIYYGVTLGVFTSVLLVKIKQNRGILKKAKFYYYTLPIVLPLALLVSLAWPFALGEELGKDLKDGR